jgi:hypothetical protein
VDDESGATERTGQAAGLSDADIANSKEIAFATSTDYVLRYVELLVTLA